MDLSLASEIFHCRDFHGIGLCTMRSTLSVIYVTSKISSKRGFIEIREHASLTTMPIETSRSISSSLTVNETYKRQGKYQESLECFDRILKIPPISFVLTLLSHIISSINMDLDVHFSHKRSTPPWYHPAITGVLRPHSQP